MKAEELLVRNIEGLDEKRDRFCTGINCMYSMCVEYLGKWMKPMEDFSCLIWMTFSEPLNLSDVGPANQFLTNGGVLIDDVKCFDLLSHLKTFTESGFNDEFTSLLAHQMGTRYFENSKSGQCHLEF
jgi:hypothetical protein